MKNIISPKITPRLHAISAGPRIWTVVRSERSADGFCRPVIVREGFNSEKNAHKFIARYYEEVAP